MMESLHGVGRNRVTKMPWYAVHVGDIARKLGHPHDPLGTVVSVGTEPLPWHRHWYKGWLHDGTSPEVLPVTLSNGETYCLDELRVYHRPRGYTATPTLSESYGPPLFLEPTYVDVLVRRYLKGETYAAIAAEHGVSSERIRQKDHKALLILRFPERRKLTKLRAHIPIWNAVFEGESWQQDDQLAVWIDE